MHPEGTVKVSNIEARAWGDCIFIAICDEYGLHRRLGLPEETFERHSGRQSLNTSLGHEM